MSTVDCWVLTVKNRSNFSVTCFFDQHQTYKLCIKVVERIINTSINFVITSGTDGMESLSSKLEKLASFFSTRSRNSLISAELYHLKHYNCCWICDINFMNYGEKANQRYLIPKNFVGQAHNECNCKRRTINFAPIVLHNWIDYVMYHIVTAFYSASQTKKLILFWALSQKSFLNFGAFIWTIKRKSDEVILQGILSRKDENIEIITRYSPTYSNWFYNQRKNIFSDKTFKNRKGFRGCKS